MSSAQSNQSLPSSQTVHSHYGELPVTAHRSSQSANLPYNHESHRGSNDHLNAEEGRSAAPISGANQASRGVASVGNQGPGLLKMSTYQGEDPTYRLVQDCGAAASAVLWSMEKKTQEVFERFVQQYVDRDDGWKTTLEGELTEAVRKHYDFLQSRIAVESLEEPGKRSFERFRLFWDGLEADGFKPPEKKLHWRKLCSAPGHENLAREALASSPEWLQKALKPFLVDSKPGRDHYDGDKLTRWMAIAVVVVAVLLSSVPIVLLAMEAISSLAGRVSVIVVANAVFGTVSMLAGLHPGVAIGITMAYSAVMVNVDV